MSARFKRGKWNTRAGVLAILVMFSMVLSACGGDATAVPSSGGTPAATGEKIVLTQWYHQYGEEGTQQAAMRYAAEYSKVNPNVTVNVVWKPGDYGTALNAALLGSDAPDVYEQSSLTPDMVKSGQVTPLDDIYGDAKSDFSEAALKAFSYDGKIYGVKMINDLGLIYYRKSMLDAAGVKPPTTLEELGAAIDKLTSGQVKACSWATTAALACWQARSCGRRGTSSLRTARWTSTTPTRWRHSPRPRRG